MTDQANAQGAEARELIAFQVAGQEFCVDVMSVREIRGWTPATPLPNAPPFVLGVVNLRGVVLPVIDLGARLGLGAATPSPRHVMVVAWIGERLVGLLVDSVCDIVTVTDAMIQPTPDVASEAVRSLVRGVLALDQRMMSLLQLEHILPASTTTAEAA